MRFHVVSLPHTQTTKEYVNCAFTEKVRRFCLMMKDLGHEVYLYAGEENEAPCDELITCISDQERLDGLNGKHFTSASFDITQPYWDKFLNTVIKELGPRLQEKDFICLIGGTSHKTIADAFPNHMSVEFGIGYGSTFAKYRVWESYSWMHASYASYRDPAKIDGFFYDAVIPGYFEPEMFPYQPEKKDYYLYIGRMIERKGVDIASQMCKEIGAKLIMAGPGNYIPEYGDYIGPVDSDKRAELMGGAIAVIAPTTYVEPFGNIVPEAHFCGTPTITTDWGAFVETNINGVTGYRCRTLDEFCKAAEDVKQLNPKVIHDLAMATYSVDVIKYKYDKYFKGLLTLWDKGWYTRL